MDQHGCHSDNPLQLGVTFIRLFFFFKQWIFTDNEKVMERQPNSVCENHVSVFYHSPNISVVYIFTTSCNRLSTQRTKLLNCTKVSFSNDVKLQVLSPVHEKNKKHCSPLSILSLWAMLSGHTPQKKTFIMNLCRN